MINYDSLYPNCIGEEVAGISKWNIKDQKAYGICISLYEQHPVNGKMSGKREKKEALWYTPEA